MRETHRRIAFVVYSPNRPYIRLRALKMLAENKYREDVVSGNLVDYIIKGMAVHFPA